MRRLQVFLSAYACEPGRGSEPGVGWGAAVALAKRHDVRVLTRANNREVIERYLNHDPIPTLTVEYYDLPKALRYFKRGQRGVRLYYYLWQLGAARHIKGMIEYEPDVVHHVTFVKYWAPAAVAWAGRPFVWGPVGGGESAPLAFWSGLGIRGVLVEILRVLARRIAELDPFVRHTARSSDIALAMTSESAARMKALGARRVHRLGESALMPSDLKNLGEGTVNPRGARVFVSTGRLLYWKGFHLGLEAFAKAGLKDAEYWIFGDGPFRRRLESIAVKLGISEQVRFFGWLDRSKSLEELAKADVLVHPSLHDSGGWVCLESMAAGRPVVCLNLGGPATQVTAETGFVVSAESPQKAVEEMADAMQRLHDEPAVLKHMAAAGKEHVNSKYTWEAKARFYDDAYDAAMGDRSAVFAD